jgi:hypothetical protein
VDRHSFSSDWQTQRHQNCISLAHPFCRPEKSNTQSREMWAHEEYLWPWAPQAHHWVNAAGGQQAGCRVGLKTIDDRVISTQHSHYVRGLPIPDEEGSVIRSSHDELTITKHNGTGEFSWLYEN